MLLRPEHRTTIVHSSKISIATLLSRVLLTSRARTNVSVRTSATLRTLSLIQGRTSEKFLNNFQQINMNISNCIKLCCEHLRALNDENKNNTVLKSNTEQ